MTFGLRLGALGSLLGLRIDDERHRGAGARGMIVLLGKERVSPVRPPDAGIDDVPVEAETSPGPDDGGTLVDPRERPIAAELR